MVSTEGLSCPMQVESGRLRQLPLGARLFTSSQSSAAKDSTAHQQGQDQRQLVESRFR